MEATGFPGPPSPRGPQELRPPPHPTQACRLTSQTGLEGRTELCVTRPGPGSVTEKPGCQSRCAHHRSPSPFLVKRHFRSQETTLSGEEH